MQIMNLELVKEHLNTGNEEWIMVFLDFRKAFDLIRHPQMFETLL